MAKLGKRNYINKILQLLDPYFVRNYFFNKYDKILNDQFVESSKYNLDNCE